MLGVLIISFEKNSAPGGLFQNNLLFYKSNKESNLNDVT